ncbi:hypothetical protein [Desulfobaculum bizertense]|uniref:Uncharacterized protein n=1 Tax=Desulfobaculum bizertense DSM 18034 TaxID=1121442 RepID=A0A1T4W2U3_9BACT|nr:hypothetical protein [Desulfobaculum bizertense]UIJ38811.1 hypothetical protein LWC08_04355 [Desulfobaculum bizertense]SKA71572.1 hypothetical protein SAMN02745702_01517 [Desulfobaculum bizertense DSM 18034]
MRTYCIEDLNSEHIERLRSQLTSLGLTSGMDDLFWLDVPSNLYTAEQKDHAEKCGPYSLGLELQKDSIRLELLVRARSIMRCSCVAYATPEQRFYAIEWLDRLLKEHDIPA